MNRSHLSYMQEQVTAIKNSPNTQKISECLFENLLMDIKDPYQELPKWTSKEDKDSLLTGLDLYSIPHQVSDDNLEHLDGLMGKHRQLITNNFRIWKREITPEWYVKINYFLDMAAKHSFRHWLGLSFFRTHLSRWCKVKQDPKNGRWKVYFHIQSQEDYHTFVKHLTLWEQEQKSGLFLKNLICFSDLDNNEIYQNRRTLFQYIITGIFTDFFQEDIPIVVETNTKNKEHNHTIDHTFKINIDGEIIHIRLLWNVKGQNSLMDKIRRDGTYSTSQAINDMIRFQIVCDNHQNLLKVLTYFVGYYKQNTGNFFLNDPMLNKLKIKDKGLINSIYPEYRNRVNDIKDPDIQLFISQALDQIDVKGANGYTDVKLLVPMTMKGKSFNTEVKFVLWDWQETNEKWLNRHEVLKLQQKIQLKSRDQKVLSTQRIWEQCQQLVTKDCPAIVEDIAKGHNNEAVKILYEHVTKDLKLLIKVDNGDDLMITNKLYKNLSAAQYYPEII